MAETSLFQQSIVHHDAFREALTEFERTRKLPAPDEARPAWRAWDAACVAAHRAVVASVDHYCARRDRVGNYASFASQRHFQTARMERLHCSCKQNETIVPIFSYINKLIHYGQSRNSV